MTLITALLLGVVEGITEFLPISSTGHLILVSELLKLPSTDFHKSFEIIIQLGAILSVVALYFKSFLDIKVLKRLFVAFLPTGIIGLALYKVVKTYLLGSEAVVLCALLIGGVLIIAFELMHKEAPSEVEPTSAHITYKQSFLIGIFQAIAIIPGTSRSAATIIGGLMLGLRRKTIVEFSFLLAVPTMLAATGLDLVQNASSFSMDQFGVLAVGFVTSFVVALFSIKFLLRYVRNHSFIAFGVYRILLALLFWFIIL
ncbi:MAG: undecaprenyl-diphosphate phosphatase [Patescibacteria group bacterium]